MNQGRAPERSERTGARSGRGHERRYAATRRVSRYAGLLALVTVCVLTLLSGLAIRPALARGAGIMDAAVAHAGAVQGAATDTQPPSLIPPDPLTNTVPASAPKVQATEAYLFDPTTGQVLYALNANQEQAMASTTKIMTTYVALHFDSPDQVMTVGQDAVNMENGISSVAGLQLGDKLTLHDLLYCLMLPSGDDAAVTVADGVAGTQTRFVGLMNLEASLLGLGHTHYANAHGLDAAGHYTSAHDLAVLTAYAMQNPLFRQIVATATYTIPATNLHAQYVLTNTNDLLSTMPYPGVLGVKTGYTGNAGYCLVFAARKGSDELIGVVLGEPQQNSLGYTNRFVDASALLTWGFKQLVAQPAATGGTGASGTPTATETPGA